MKEMMLIAMALVALVGCSPEEVEPLESGAAPSEDACWYSKDDQECESRVSGSVSVESCRRVTLCLRCSAEDRDGNGCWRGNDLVRCKRTCQESR